MNMSAEIVEQSEDEIVINNPTSQETPKRRGSLLLLPIYMIFTAVGVIGGPLLQRLYFTHGGSLKWLQSLLASIGFVAALPVISLLYLRSRAVRNSNSDGSIMDFKLFISACLIGLLTGLMNYMFSTGLAYIPVSTSSLLSASQLAFTSVFAFLLVRQKFTFYTYNSVLLITLGAVALSLHTSSDRPPGVSKGKYLLGFFMTLGGAALTGLVSPVVELAYNKSSKPITFLLVLQFQAVINAFAAAVATVGMLVNNEFNAIPREASGFDMGKAKYYLIIVWVALIYQLSVIGGMGVISCTSSLFTGIFASVLLPLSQIAAVITFHEKFTGQKGLSLALSVWGFASYFVGSYKKSHKPKPVVNGVEDSRTADQE